MARAWDEQIADYAEKTRGQFNKGDLREVVYSSPPHIHRASQQYAHPLAKGEVFVVLEDDKGVFADEVMVLTRQGVQNIRRTFVSVNTRTINEVSPAIDCFSW